MNRVRHSLVLVLPAPAAGPPAAPAPDKKAPDPSLSARLWKMVEGALPALLSSIVLAGFAYYLTGRIETSLKQRQATISGVKEMTPLLTQLADPNLTEAAGRAPMRQLTMYGEDAIGPVITLSLTAGLPIGLSNDGLGLLAVHHHDEVCAALHQVSVFGPTMWGQTMQLKALLKLPSKLKCAGA